MSRKMIGGLYIIYLSRPNCRTMEWLTHKLAWGKTSQRPACCTKGNWSLSPGLSRRRVQVGARASLRNPMTLKRMFKVKYNGDEASFHKYWPQGFRWTCCGTNVGIDWRCDHHGTGSKPCTCDFCRRVALICYRVPALDDIVLDLGLESHCWIASIIIKSAARHGLKLRRHPGRHFFHAGITSMCLRLVGLNL